MTGKCLWFNFQSVGLLHHLSAYIKTHSHTLRDHCSLSAMEMTSVLLVCMLVLTCSGILFLCDILISFFHFITLSFYYFDLITLFFHSLESTWEKL